MNSEDTPPPARFPLRPRSGRESPPRVTCLICQAGVLRMAKGRKNQAVLHVLDLCRLYPIDGANDNEKKEAEAYIVALMERVETGEFHSRDALSLLQAHILHMQCGALYRCAGGERRHPPREMESRTDGKNRINEWGKRVR